MKRLIIEVEDDGHCNVGKADNGIMFSTGGKLRLMERRLVLDFKSPGVLEVIGETLGLQPVTDREQVLCTAVMMLTVAAKADVKVCGDICQMLTGAGFQV